MTLKEIKESNVKTVAEWLFKLGACPMETGEEPGCICDDEGDHDCRTCWEMHLNGEDRENVVDDAKEYGRGYYV